MCGGVFVVKGKGYRYVSVLVDSVLVWRGCVEDVGVCVVSILPNHSLQLGFCGISTDEIPEKPENT